jgi:redox-sensitive bicupin YhaK (pirin superfamily)
MMVGPFIFFDHPGPAQFAPGQGVDVRPHPHINLATVTYLFEGALLHRDSLGYVQEIHPGAVNWMTAGKGISHSERTPDAERAAGHTLHGIQTWVALPDEAEEIEPSFHHHPAAEIPTWEVDGVKVTLIAGEAYGHVSPVKSLSPILYLNIQFPTGGTFVLNAEYSERAVYPLTAGITVAGTTLEPYRMAILHPGQSVEITAGAAEDTAWWRGASPWGNGKNGGILSPVVLSVLSRLSGTGRLESLRPCRGKRNLFRCRT